MPCDIHVPSAQTKISPLFNANNNIIYLFHSNVKVKKHTSLKEQIEIILKKLITVWNKSTRVILSNGQIQLTEFKESDMMVLGFTNFLIRFAFHEMRTL